MTRRAFTLVELLVVIAIIGLLSSVAVVALGGAGANARNAKRKADLVQISKALELYYSDNGAYPSTGGSSNYRGNCIDGGSYPDSGAGAWIPNFQSYLSPLPHDTKTGKAVNLDPYCQAHPNSSCYLYTSNGVEYKAYAFCLAEGSLASIAADQMSNGGSSYVVFTPGARAW